MQRSLIVIGAACILVGILWPWLSKLPLGRLPGDIRFERPGVVFYFPITSMIIISAILTFAAWLLRK